MKKPSAPNNKKPIGSQSAPRTRHSKAAKDPVTIDLSAEDVKKKSSRSAVPAARRSEPQKSNDAKSDAKPKREAAQSVKNDAATSSGIASNRSKSTEPTKAPEAAKKTETKPSDKKPAAAANSTAAATPPPSKPAAKNENVKSGSGGGKLVAGIVGGVIALGGAAGAQYAGLLGTLGSTQPEAAASVSPEQLSEARISLQEQIAALEARLAEQAASSQEQANAASAVDMDVLNSRIDARVDEQVGAAITALPPSAGAGESDSAALDALQQADARVNSALQEVQSQLASTQQAVSDLQGAINGGEAGETAALSAIDSQLKQTGEAVAALSNRVETLEQADPAATANEDLTESLSSLNEQLSAIQTQLDATRSNLTNLQEQQIAPLQETVAQKTEALSKQVSETSGRLDGLQEETQKISALSIRLNEVSSRLSGVTDQVTKQGEAMSALQEATTTRRRADQQAAQAIAAAALKGDVDQGRPFGGTLATLRQVSGDETLLAEIEPYAEKGVSTKAQLVERFSAVRDAMEAAITPKSDGSLTSRLLSSAQSLVKVKPLEPLEGDTPAAKLSQLDSAMQEGDLAKASALWEVLPDAAKNVSQEWHADVKARLAANGMVDTAVKSFLLTNATQ